MEKIFKNNGFLHQLLPGYELRQEQLDMAMFLHEQLYEGKASLVEAATGTGKTLAYLIPALLFARDEDKKIAVSTETKALQKQLLEKDLPVVQKMFKQFFGHTFRYSLCLGGANYPCRKRFDLAVAKGKFLESDLSRLRRVQSLFNKKIIFTRFDLFLPGYIWEEIFREGEACSSFRCVFSEHCPFQMARKEWAEADLLIMNHYLFFTNIAFEKTYLPSCDVVIFDEAHSVEEIAAAQLGFSHGYNQLMEILARFYRKRRKGTLLYHIQSRSLQEKSIELVKQGLAEASHFYENLRPKTQGDNNQVRIRHPLGIGEKLIHVLKELMMILMDTEDDFNKDEALRMEFDIARGKLFVYAENLTTFVYHTKDSFVYWIEREGESIAGDIMIKGQPVNVNDIMAEDVVSFYDSLVFVSATLAISGEFKFIANRLGIRNYQKLICKSPFDYQKQMVLYVAHEIEEPHRPRYIDQALTYITKIVSALKGNCLILFTSYSMLAQVREGLAAIIDYPVFDQGSMTAAEAVREYVATENSVLLGTHSFWQGIDLPGDLLRGVIVMKLPFSVPDYPPVQARIEGMQEAGINPFAGYQIPEAIIRFKQGCGRLIRSSRDKGIVAILDSRVVTKGYGRMFINALPQCKLVKDISLLPGEYLDLF